MEAVIDAPQVVNKQSEVILDGSKNVNAKVFEWKVLEGPAYKLEDSDKSIAKFIPISEGTYKIQLKVSNGEAEDTDTISIESKPISSVVITFPTLDENYITTNNKISLKGYISGHIVSVKAINVFTSKEYQAILDNGSFVVENVELQQGDNLIKVIGVDSIGKEFQDTLIVTYNPDIEFLSNPVLTPDVAFVNETTSFTARVAIAQNANISEVKLFKVDENNNPVEEIATLYDDGNVNNGDDIAGDGVYSSKFTINPTEEGTIKYRVVVDNKAYSTVASLTITSHITDEQIATAKQVITNALNTLPETAVSEEEANQAIDNLIYTLKNDPNVSKVEVSPNEKYIEIVTKNGIHEAIGFSYVDNETGVQTEGDFRYSPPVPNDFRKSSFLYYAKSINFVRPKSTKGLTNKASNNNEIYIGSYNVIHLEPMAFNIGTLKKNIFEDYDEFTVTYLENYDVTVETFKNLNKYGIIIIHSHGGWGSVFLTGQETTIALKLKYAVDLITDRLKIFNHVVLVKDKSNGFWIFKWGKETDVEKKSDVFAISYKFIQHYYQNKKLPGSLVFLGMCEGLEQDNLANAFISAGAKTVVGFTDTVWSTYDKGIFNAFFNSLLSSKTVEEAVNDDRNTMGENDEAWYQNTYGKKAKEYTPAKFEFRGEGKLKFFKEGILNGSFEDNLKYWEGEGDVRVISALGPLAPQDGSYMAIISTGLGSVNDSNSYVLQKFKVPLDANTLSFMYDVVSEEPMEWVGTKYDDKFQASIIDEKGNEEIIVTETINTSQWDEISGIDFYGGDDTTYHTGWKSVNFDISKYRGKTITIKFHVWDKGDSIYDTAALIDEVEVQ